MKTVKSILALFLVVAIVGASNAQDKKVEFGIMGGYGHSMPRIKDSRPDAEKITHPLATLAMNDHRLNGFHVGPMLKFNVTDQVGFQVGALFNHFGTTYLDRSQRALKKNTGTWQQTKTSLNAIDVPLRFVYSVSLADEFNVFLFGGPNINYAITKTSTTERYVSNERASQTKGENIYQKPSSYNALDLQIGAGMGLQYYGVSLRAGYDWGLLNRTTIDNISLRANDIKVSLAYSF